MQPLCISVRTLCRAAARSASTAAAAAGEAGQTPHPYGGLFASQAGQYAKFRPQYGPETYDPLFDYVKHHGTGDKKVRATTGGVGAAARIRRAHRFARCPLPVQVAVDIACGNGQATIEIAKHYAEVVGIDASPQQVAQAPPAANVRFRLGTAEATTLPDASADLVTVAQAMHWFRLPEFYREAHRILRPRGTLAIWGYLYGSIEGGPDPDKDTLANALKTHVWYGIVGPYWDPARAILDSGYAGCDPPTSLFDGVRRHEYSMSKDISIAEMVGYASSWSAYASFMKAQAATVKPGSDDDPLVVFQRELCRIYSTDDIHGYRTRIKFPMVMLLATKKG